jgi:hypothetical protein
MFEWRLPKDSLLNIALDHLILVRARLYRLILNGDLVSFAGTGVEIEKAVAGLRTAGDIEFVPRGLLTRAWLRKLQGKAEDAQADLDEAQEIAERGSMKLHLADVALYRARLFQNRVALVEARRLVEECGYGRRLPEIEDLEAAADTWSKTSPIANSGRTGVTAKPKKRFRVALSFAGENRSYVAAVAEHLAARLGWDRVLYDNYHAAEFARPDLDVYLQSLYRDESELIAVFLSADYERKEWCGLEWRVVRELIKKRQPESVMPLRFDMTEIPGLFSGDGYIWLANRPPEEAAELILQRLKIRKGKGKAGPTTPAAVVVAPRPPASAPLAMWSRKLEHLLAQEPITVDPDQRFRLTVLIEEARAKIREHGGSA